MVLLVGDMLASVDETMPARRGHRRLERVYSFKPQPAFSGRFFVDSQAASLADTIASRHTPQQVFLLFRAPEDLNRNALRSISVSSWVRPIVKLPRFNGSRNMAAHSPARILSPDPTCFIGDGSPTPLRWSEEVHHDFITRALTSMEAQHIFGDVFNFRRFKRREHWQTQHLFRQHCCDR